MKKEPKWFQIMHHPLTDANTVIDSLSSSALDHKSVLNENELHSKRKSLTKKHENKSSNAGSQKKSIYKNT